MKNKNIIIYVLTIILTIALGVGIGFGVSKLAQNNNEQEVKDNNNKEVINEDNLDDEIVNYTNIDNVIIKNEEVKELYDYVKASLSSNSVCKGYYYQNPLINHTLEDKISLVLANYAHKFSKGIDNEFLQKISIEDRNSVKTNSVSYIDAKTVKEGMKKIFNISIDNFKEGNNHYSWEYRSDVDAFISIDGGGGYDANIKQQVIAYKETKDEISITEVKAELLYDSMIINDTKILAGVYRYINKTDTLVTENITNFKFTVDNVDQFPQIKYVFKKSEEGRYYLADIINLNFEDDYEKCN